MVDLRSQRRMRSAVATADRLLDSAILALRELPLTDVSLGAIAKQAGVPESAAAELFPSVSDVIVDICLRRIRGVDIATDATSGSVTRVTAQLTSAILLVAEEPAVAAACASVFLDPGQAGQRARDVIGFEIHRLIVSASGPWAWPEVRTTLELAFTGTLIQAAMGAMPYDVAVDRLRDAVHLLLEIGPQR
ncbi:TetR/AcrR family transcriptional regulator [Mycolicibacterium fluoranthenivorans]|uniref:TetR/AcrR family transcriptional regulator n=1 Tax=Mycolicibacterium fluoranthenivorans TaxID=258505 RepID=A0A7G8P6W2_9MYCO|nr:TetR/AcrR family transcriptional regulator [Mycolicibacterium fluoranthenivorans]QNJ90078.1 TetR/AcrR family transcriptional regulator [Mycolicibacterium fluoranthenivorans]